MEVMEIFTGEFFHRVVTKGTFVDCFQNGRDQRVIHRGFGPDIVDEFLP